MSNEKHTPGPWVLFEVGGDNGTMPAQCPAAAATNQSILTVTEEGGTVFAAVLKKEDARLIAAAPDYHDSAELILRAVTTNAAPVNPLVALEEMALAGDHVTLDAGLVLDLLKAHAKATGSAA